MAESQPLQHILCALALDAGDNVVTMTELDRRVLQQAFWLASCVGARVTLFHGMGLTGGRDLAELDAHVRQAEDYCRAAMGAAADNVDASNVAYSSVVSTENAGRTMKEFARDNQVDLIVCGRRKEHLGLKYRLFLGHTSARFIRHANVPVWVVHPEGPKGLRKILVAVDFSPAAEQLVAVARNLAEMSGATLHLLHCVDYPTDIALRRLPDAEHALAEYHRRVEADAKTSLTHLIREDPDAWEIRVGIQGISRVVSGWVEEANIDLVLLAHASRPPFADAVLGSTAERILECTETSMWVVRPTDRHES